MTLQALKREPKIKKPRTCRTRSFYIDDETYEWLNEQFGSSEADKYGGISKYVRDVLKYCRENNITGL